MAKSKDVNTVESSKPKLDIILNILNILFFRIIKIKKKITRFYSDARPSKIQLVMQSFSYTSTSKEVISSILQ